MIHANDDDGDDDDSAPAEPTRATILLVTIGTLGDLHPFIAIGLALKRRGCRPVLAVAEDHVAGCRAAGLEATAVMPGFDAVCRAMNLDHAQAVHHLMDSQRAMLDRLLIPGLAASLSPLDALAADAKALVSSPFALGSLMVAERRELPLISVILQPMALLSAVDPPRTPDFWMMRPSPAGTIGRTWNRLVFAGLRRAVRLLYGRRIDRIRRSHGLAPSGARHLLEAPPQAVLRLGVYSTILAPLPPDAPPGTRLTGFPTYDGEGVEELDKLLRAFLAAGPPPIVFTLGSFAVGGAGRFFDRARVAAAQVGRRALLLVGGNRPPRWNGDVLVCSYAPHSLVFPHAQIVVHHGGVGTTGQAMRAGKPQLVVPHMGDQHDHAARVARLGIGRRLDASRFTATRAVRALIPLLANPDIAVRAAAVAAAMREEDGAAAAADAIIDVLDLAKPSPDRVP